MLRRYSPFMLAVAGLVWQVMAPFATAQDNLADVIEKSEQSVVKIIVDSKAGKSLGSGYVVDASGIIITNVHVLRAAQKADATFPNGTTVAVKGTYKFDENRDICVAQLDGAGFPVLAI